MKIKNNDGTTIEIKKDINMSGKEELFEITYDPQGNIIGRKKAFGGKNNVKYKFHDMLDYKKNNIPNNYYIYEGNNFYVKTSPKKYNYQKINTNYINNNEIKNKYSPLIHQDFNRKVYNIKNIRLAKVKKINNNNNNNNNNKISYFNNDLNKSVDNILNNNYIYNNNFINNSQNIFINNYAQNINYANPVIKFARVKKIN